MKSIITILILLTACITHAVLEMQETCTGDMCYSSDEINTIVAGL